MGTEKIIYLAKEAYSKFVKTWDFLSCSYCMSSECDYS